MGDEQVRQAQALLQVHQQVEHLRLDRDVERRHRLVAEQQVRLQRQGAGDADPLALSARELVRIAVGHRRQQADQVEQLGDPFAEPAAAPGDAMDLERFAHDLPHPHAGIERAEGILKHHLHASPQRAQPALVDSRDVLAVEDDPPCRRLQHPQDRQRRRRLAAAALPHQAEGLAPPEFERHAVDRLDGPDAPPHQHPLGNREMDLQVLDPQQDVVRTVHAAPSS